MQHECFVLFHPTVQVSLDPFASLACTRAIFLAIITRAYIHVYSYYARIVAAEDTKTRLNRVFTILYSTFGALPRFFAKIHGADFFSIEKEDEKDANGSTRFR